MSQIEATTRRAFLCAAGRYVTLGGLLAGSAYLIAPRRGLPTQDAACRRKFACAGCAQSENCALPQGIAARQAPAQPRVPG